jgi:hypothetical protein
MKVTVCSFLSIALTFMRLVGKSNPVTGLDRPLGLRKLRLSEFLDIRHMKVVRLSDIHTGLLYPSRRYPWYPFLLEADSTPGPYCGWKD